jgi:hypothetical protein
MNLADLFTVSTLTASINKLPAFPGKVGALGLFEESGISTTTVTVGEDSGKLVLVANQSRNADPEPIKANKRKNRTFECAHLPLTTQLLPTELQNLMPFGAEQGVLMSQAKIINDRMEVMKSSIEATREHHRIGALRGKILDADGSTVLVDLYQEFGVVKKAVNIQFSVGTTDVRKAMLDAKRHSETKIGGSLPIFGFVAFVSPEFYDALTSHPKVEAAYANWAAAADRIGGDLRSGFTYADITFIEYNVSVGGVPMIPAGKGILVPKAKGAYIMRNAPANYNETVNTLGLPYYAKGIEREFNKGWKLEAQANPLALNLFPEAIVEMTAT